MGNWFLVLGILIGGMSHPDYKVREGSTKSLICLNNEYNLQGLITPVAKTHSDMEVRIRLKRVLEAYENPRPTISCLYPKITSYEDINNPLWHEAFMTYHYIDCENYTYGETVSWTIVGPDDHDCKISALQAATHMFIKSMQEKNKITRKEAVDILNIMCENEKNGKRFEPEPEQYGPSAQAIIKTIFLFVR
jgi:hypothetical protein